MCILFEFYLSMPLMEAVVVAERFTGFGPYLLLMRPIAWNLFNSGRTSLDDPAWPLHMLIFSVRDVPRRGLSIFKYNPTGKGKQFTISSGR
jgi:hypothetical protein